MQRFRAVQTVIVQIDAEVIIARITNGHIPGPIGKTNRAKTLVKFRDLVKALRKESGTAIRHRWEITWQISTLWRNSLAISAKIIGQSTLWSAY